MGNFCLKPGQGLQCKDFGPLNSTQTSLGYPDPSTPRLGQLTSNPNHKHFAGFPSSDSVHSWDPKVVARIKVHIVQDKICEFMNILNFPYAIVYFVLKNKHVYWTVSVTPSFPGNVQSWCVLKYAEVNFCWRQWGCCEKKRNKDWNCYLHNKKKLNLILILNKHEHSIREGLAGDIRTIQASWPNLKITFKARNERKRNWQEKKLS